MSSLQQLIAETQSPGRLLVDALSDWCGREITITVVHRAEGRYARVLERYGLPDTLDVRAQTTVQLRTVHLCAAERPLVRATSMVVHHRLALHERHALRATDQGLGRVLRANGIQRVPLTGSGPLPRAETGVADSTVINLHLVRDGVLLAAVQERFQPSVLAAVRSVGCA